MWVLFWNNNFKVNGFEKLMGKVFFHTTFVKRKMKAMVENKFNRGWQEIYNFTFSSA